MEAKRLRLFLLVLIQLITLQELQDQILFVSTFTQGGIVRLNAATGEQQTIYYDPFLFRPEGIAVGPDGKIYVCDSLGGRILRMKQDGTQVEIIYDRSWSPYLKWPGGPEGPSFLGPDLYFNTRGNGVKHTGVWKIAGAAEIAYGRKIPAPVQLITELQTESSFGEGTTFTPAGELLIVDRSGNRVLKAKFPFSSAVPLINSDLDRPFGIAVRDNEILIASDGSRQKNINRFNLSTGQFLGTLAVFQNYGPHFIDLDSAGNLYLAMDNGAIWQIDRQGLQKYIPASLIDSTGLSVAKTFSGCVSTGADQACLLDANQSDPLKSRLPLVMVHGWNRKGQPADPKTKSFELLANYIRSDESLSAKYKLYYFTYYSNEVSVSELGAAFRDVLDLKNESDPEFGKSPLVIIGHSMGGLVSRSFMQEQKQAKGAWADKLGGERMKVLITLGTPHHGTPVANRKARDQKLRTEFAVALELLELGLGPENQVNRSDLLWDNYDKLLDYKNYPNEKNQWLANLNSGKTYDSKIVAYAGVTAPDRGCLVDFYCHGSTILGDGFDLPNDGIVPLSSAFFFSPRNWPRTNATPRHYFSGYNHSEIVEGKPDDDKLFEQIRSDLLRVK